MRGLAELQGGRVRLAPFEPAWVEAYVRWLADPYIQSMAGETAESTQQVLTRHRSWTDDPSFVEYIILEKASGVPIGDVSLSFSSTPAKFGIMIGEPAFRGRGFAAEAARLLLDHARERGWLDIVAEVYDHNQSSLDFHLKLGFQLLEHDLPGHQWVLGMKLG